MTPVTVFEGKRVAVFGLGGSGFVSAQALVAGGARVLVWDDNEHAREKARAAGLRIENLAAGELAAILLRSSFRPAFRLTHPAPHWTVMKARQAGVEIIGDIEFFCRERAEDRPQLAVRGDHRNEWKIDDDGARRASFQELRFYGRGRRQYRHADPRLGAAVATSASM